MTQLTKKALLKSNLEYWLNDKLLREGLYTNIELAEQNVYGEDISVLIPQSVRNYTDGQVWQSAFKNWVYESGIPSPYSGVPSPLAISGVTVDGTFYPSSTVGAFAHNADYTNGRIIFQSAISTSSIVQAEFSYKHIFVADANRFNKKQQELLLETEWKDNPDATGIQNYPSESAVVLPAIWIEVIGRMNKGYEVGSSSNIADFNCIFHVWGKDTFVTDKLEDLLGDEDNVVLLGINFNTAPFPLLSKGRKNPAWTQYSDYAQLWTPYFWRRIYINKVESRQDPPLDSIERNRVSFMSRIYPNF